MNVVYLLLILLIVIVVFLLMKNTEPTILIVTIVTDVNTFKLVNVHCNGANIKYLVAIDKNVSLDSTRKCKITSHSDEYEILKIDRTAREEIRQYGLQNNYDAILILEQGHVLSKGALRFALRSNADVVLFPYRKKSLVVLYQDENVIMVDPKMLSNKGDSFKILGGQGALFIKKSGIRSKFEEMTMIINRDHSIFGDEIGFFKNLDVAGKEVIVNTRIYC